MIGGERISLTPPPGHKRVRDWYGKRVRTTRSLTNGVVTMPAGSLATVKNTPSGTGLHLKFDGCPSCGCAAHMSRVRADDVEVIA